MVPCWARDISDSSHGLLRKRACLRGRNAASRDSRSTPTYALAHGFGQLETPLEIIKPIVAATKDQRRTRWHQLVKGCLYTLAQSASRERSVPRSQKLYIRAQRSGSVGEAIATLGQSAHAGTQSIALAPDNLSKKLATLFQNHVESPARSSSTKVSRADETECSEGVELIRKRHEHIDTKHLRLTCDQCLSLARLCRLRPLYNRPVPLATSPALRLLTDGSFIAGGI